MVDFKRYLNERPIPVYPSNNVQRTPAQRWNMSTFSQLREWLASEGQQQQYCQSTFDMVPEEIAAKWVARWRAKP